MVKNTVNDHNFTTAIFKYETILKYVNVAPNEQNINEY
jgi:hypothetical protein